MKSLRLGSCFVVISAFLIGLLGGCSNRAKPTTPRTFDDPAGPIVKTTGPLHAGIDVPPGQGPWVTYLANGYAKTASTQDRSAGRSLLRFYNPTNVDNEFTVLVYFDNRPPVELTRFALGPNDNGKLISIPSDFPGFFDGSEAWGARITSTAPSLAINVLSAGVVAPNGDLWFGDKRYKGGNTVAHARGHLATRWFFSDGLVLEWEEEKMPGQLFNEYEWYHVLNPNSHDAEVAMHCHYGTGETDTFTFTVRAERVRIINNKDLARPNQAHAVEIVSSIPVLATANRFIYDFEATNDWGAWIHANHEGIPIDAIVLGAAGKPAPHVDN